MAVLEHLGKGVQGPTDTLFSVRGNGRKWAAGLAARSYDNPADLVIVGDSVTELMYGAYVYRLRERFAHFNDGKMSPGWINGAALSSDVTGGVNIIQPYAFRLTTGSYGTPGTNNSVDEYGLGMYSFRLASGSVLTLQSDPNEDGTWTDAVTATPQFKRAIFGFSSYGTDSFVGTLELRVDGVLVNGGAAVDTYDATNGLGVFESHHTYVWEGTQGPHTITVTGAGGSPSWFDGVYLQADTETVRIWNAGNAGENYGDLLAEPTGFADPPTFQAIGAIDADAVILVHGINDYDSGNGLPALETNIPLAISGLRALCDDVSLGVAVPYPTSSRTDWPRFADGMRRQAAKNDVPVLDLSWMLKTAAASTDPHGLVGADDVHQSAEGGEFYADRFAEFLLGCSVNWMDLVTTMDARLISDERDAKFTGLSFDPGLIVTKHDAGRAYLLLRDDKTSLAASSGLLGEIGMNGRGATVPLGAGGLNALAWLRFRAPSTWTDTSAPLDLEWGNCASGSVTSAVRMTLLAGGGLKFPEITPPAGAADHAIMAARDVSGATEWGVVMPDSSYRTLASSSFTSVNENPEAALRPAGVLAETMDRWNTPLVNVNPLTTQVLTLVAIPLKAGMVITNIGFVTGATAAVTPTNWWYSLHDSARALLRQTADQTTTAIAALTEFPKALTSTYAITISGLYYLGIMVKATTVPTLYGITTGAPVTGIPPILNGASTTGLTTTAPNPAAAITSGGIRPYAYVS